MNGRVQVTREWRSGAQLELQGIRKVYGSTVANDGIDLIVRPGEIHAILGENGAGKSTLMKIIYGVTPPSAGRMRWCGEDVRIQSPAHARSIGIGMVFQHFALFETLTVVQNIALALPGYPDLEDLERRIITVGKRYGLEVDPHHLVHALSVGERQRVEIIRCLLQNPRLLIMDEPTSVLTPQAVQKLFETLRELSTEGCSILFISHKLDEVQELCDSATVLRGGKLVGHCIPAQETHASMARLMMGKEVSPVKRDDGTKPGETRLELKSLSQPALHPFGVALDDINLQVRAGEIVGIAGVSGNGQQELLQAMSGETRLPREHRDMIRIDGQPAGHLGSATRRRRGLGFVPEERLGRGAVPSMSLADNALLTAYGKGLVSKGLKRTAAIRDFAERCIKDFAVKCSGTGASADSLSGGNLQKYIVGRELLQTPRVLIVAQPTWGVDVNAAASIRQALVALRDAGGAVLVISEEIEELMEVSDRINVIAKGKLSPSIPIQDADIETIGIWMSGMWPGNGAAQKILEERELEDVS